MPTVSCIVVTYGPTPSLIPMIESLHRTVRASETEVIVLTQPDEHGSMDRDVASRWPSIRLVELGENLGFGGANNVGVEMAEAPLVALLNPDLVLPEGWLAPLVGALDDESVTIVGPPLLTPFGEIGEVGQIMYSDGGSEPFGGPGFAAPYDALMFSRDVDYSSAACWLMRRGDFAELGGFSTAYAPAYFEDVDLAFRVWQRGGRCRVVTARPVIHDHAPASRDRVSLAERSREVFRTTWATELAHQPLRSPHRDNFVAVRDHRCVERREVVVSKRAGVAEARRIVDEAGQWAETNPRARMTVRSTTRPEVEEWRRAWCARGLEIAITEP